MPAMQPTGGYGSYNGYNHYQTDDQPYATDNRQFAQQQATKQYQSQLQQAMADFSRNQNLAALIQSQRSQGQQQGGAYPFQFSQGGGQQPSPGQQNGMAGLGNFYTPYPTGHAQSTPYQGPMSNFLGSQWNSGYQPYQQPANNFMVPRSSTIGSGVTGRA